MGSSEHMAAPHTNVPMQVEAYRSFGRDGVCCTGGLVETGFWIELLTRMPGIVSRSSPAHEHRLLQGYIVIRTNNGK